MPASILPAATCCCIGAGGAASGVLGPLIEARPRRIVVANRTQAKAGVHARAALRHLRAQHGVELEAPDAAAGLAMHSTW